MTEENNEGAAPQEDTTEAEEPRAKTPLELLREQQARMRGNKPNSGHAADNRQGAGAADAYKRRQHQRRAG